MRKSGESEHKLESGVGRKALVAHHKNRAASHSFLLALLAAAIAPSAVLMAASIAHEAPTLAACFAVGMRAAAGAARRGGERPLELEEAERREGGVAPPNGASRRGWRSGTAASARCASRRAHSRRVVGLLDRRLRRRRRRRAGGVDAARRVAERERVAAVELQRRPHAQPAALVERQAELGQQRHGATRSPHDDVRANLLAGGASPPPPAAARAVAPSGVTRSTSARRRTSTPASRSRSAAAARTKSSGDASTKLARAVDEVVQLRRQVPAEVGGELDADVPAADDGDAERALGGSAFSLRPSAGASSRP